MAKPDSRAAESLVGMAYALSGVRRQQQQDQNGKHPSKSNLISRILGQRPEEKPEVAVE